MVLELEEGEGCNSINRKLTEFFKRVEVERGGRRMTYDR
jgi:hypothetical protein